MVIDQYLKRYEWCVNADDSNFYQLLCGCLKFKFLDHIIASYFSKLFSFLGVFAKYLTDSVYQKLLKWDHSD